MSYYKTTDPVAMEKARLYLESAAAHRNAALALSAEVGASNSKFYTINGCFEGFFFEHGANPPPYFYQFRIGSGAWWPKRRTPEGKQITEQIRSLPKILDVRELNQSIAYTPSAYFTPGGGMVFADSPHFVLTAEALFFRLPDQVDWYRAPAHVTEIVGSEFSAAAKKMMESQNV